MKLINVVGINDKAKEERLEALEDFMEAAQDSDYCIMMTEDIIYFVNVDDNEAVFALERAKHRAFERHYGEDEEY